MGMPARGPAELVVDQQHYHRIVRDGLLGARLSLDVMTADFKAMLVPAAELGAPVFSRILTAPALTTRPAARAFSSCTAPAPALVIVFPVAVRFPVIASVLAAGVTVIVVSLLSTRGAAIAWLPLTTLIAA